MGREVRRVPLGFDWPINKVWGGNLLPDELHAIPCEACNSTGLNPKTRQLAEGWYDHAGFGTRWWYDYKTGRDGQPATRPPWKVFGECRSWEHNITQDEVQALVDHGRLMDFTHTWVPGEGWQRKPGNTVPTAEEINEWSHHGFGHDAINRIICVEARAKRLGIYGTCPHCGGGGETFRDEEHRKAHEAWEPTDPPEGPGYQMWETTSEGSPMSPVCETPESLAMWLSTNKASAFGSETATYGEWLAMIRGPGWAPSAMASSGRLESGVSAVAAMSEPGKAGDHS